MVWLAAQSLLGISLSLSLATAFTPEDLLSSPRRSLPVPNKAGTLGIYSESAYSFEQHLKRNFFNLLDFKSGHATDLGSNIGEAVWFGTDDTTILLKNTTTEGTTNLWLCDASKPDERQKVGTIPGTVSYVKPIVSNGTVHLVFSSKTHTNGTIYNRKNARHVYASGMVYESLFVRHWDHYVFPEKRQLFSISFKNDSGTYTIDDSTLTNLFGENSPLETPVDPFGGGSDFDVSPDGNHVAFISKDPDLNPANNTRQLVYLVPLTGWHAPTVINDPEAKDTHGKKVPQGAASNPKFSPDGHTLAFLQMYENGYESDINKIFTVSYKSPLLPIAKSWDVSPGSIDWALDGKSLYVIAENKGHVKLYNVPLDDSDITEVWKEHSVHGISFLPGGKLLLGISSLVSSLRPYIFDPSEGEIRPLWARPEAEKALKYSQVEEWSFTGSLGYEIHGFIIKPSNFEKSEKAKYPMALFIHGGPQGAWSDSWSTRWNPAVFAEHGYVVVTVNPTGSTGYGQDFVDAIKTQWGGRPYIDIDNAVEYLQNHSDFDYIDFDRMTALGASYGGFMINYIQGMPLGRKFKALVCHDGVFSTLNQIMSEELYFPQHDFGGTLWESRAEYEKWDPARMIDQWATPQMIIHSELDYRLPVTEGLAAFNVLQERGVPSKILIFPDENHWVLKPENSLQWHQEVFEWLDRWTKPREKILAAKSKALQRGSNQQPIMGAGSEL